MAGKVLICLGVVVLLAWAIIRWREIKAAAANRVRLQPADQPAEAAAGIVPIYQLGDRLEYHALSGVVRGILDTDEVYPWSEYWVDFGPLLKSQWLSVTYDPDTRPTPEVVLWIERAESQLVPPIGTYLYKGVTYQQVSRASIYYDSVGATDRPPSGSIRYREYRSTDGTNRYLSLIQFDDAGTWTVREGELLNLTDLTVVPAKAR